MAVDGGDPGVGDLFAQQEALQAETGAVAEDLRLDQVLSVLGTPV